MMNFYCMMSPPFLLFSFIFQFVCMGGTPKRVEQFAFYIMEEIGHKLPAGTTLQDISQFSYRYSMYKVGPVLSISVSFKDFFFQIVKKRSDYGFDEMKFFPARNGHTFRWDSPSRSNQTHVPCKSKRSRFLQDRNLWRNRD